MPRRESPAVGSSNADGRGGFPPFFERLPDRPEDAPRLPGLGLLDDPAGAGAGFSAGSGKPCFGATMLFPQCGQ